MSTRKTAVTPSTDLAIVGEVDPRFAGDILSLQSDFIVLERKYKTLKRSESRYRRLFETAKDGILILDGDTGRIVDANPFLQEMLGYTESELIGKALWEIGAVKDIPASQAAMRELQNNEYIRYEDIPLLTKSGERRNVEFVSNVYLVDGWRVIQCNIRDITERKQAEAQERREAEEANNSKLMFLNMLSHELRTPLASIKGFATTLLADDVEWKPENQRDFLEIISSEADKLSSLIEQLLDSPRLAELHSDWKQ